MQEKTDECTALILDAKIKYVRCMSNKLNDPLTAINTYWSILNPFLNNRKISVIPPLLVNGDIITSLSKKADLFNKFFADQCTPLNDLNKLPPLYLKADKKLCNLSINKNGIFTITTNLDPNKSDGLDNLSLRIIKLCGDSLIYPLKCIFEGALQQGKYPGCWKKANVVPVHKKENKSLIKNYRPISLLPILGKIFKRLIYKDLFNHFYCNNLFTKNQSGFIPGYSCIFQLLSIVYEINSSLDCNPTKHVRVVFLDISKAFDKVWHEELFSKLGGELLNLFKDYLQECQ